MCSWLVLVLALTFCHRTLGMATLLPVVSVDRLSRLETLTSSLSRQLMLQQLYVEEKTRTEGDSGIKQVTHRQIIVIIIPLVLHSSFVTCKFTFTIYM